MAYLPTSNPFLDVELVEENINAIYDQVRVLANMVNHTAVKSTTVSFFRESDYTLAGSSDVAPGASFPVDLVPSEKTTAYMHQKGLGARILWSEIITNRIDVAAQAQRKVAEGLAKLEQDAIVAALRSAGVSQASDAVSGFWDASVRTTRFPQEQILKAYDLMASRYRSPKELICSPIMASYLLSNPDSKPSDNPALKVFTAGETGVWGYLPQFGNLKVVAVAGLGNDTAYLTDLKRFITFNTVEAPTTFVEEKPGRFVDYFAWMNGGAHVIDQRAAVALTNISE